MEKKIGLFGETTGLASVQRGLCLAAILAPLCIGAASSADAQSSSTPIVVRVGGNDTNSGLTPLFAAERLGYFKEAGLDVKFITIGGGAAPMAAALKAGELDVAIAGAIQHMTDMAKGIINGKIVGELTDNNQDILGGNGITDIKQLKGKIFGISSYNGGDQLYAIQVLAHFGIGQNDVTWLPVGVPVSRAAALPTGSIDATVMSEHQIPDAVANRVIMKASDSPAPFVANSFFVRQDFLATNKPAVQKLLAAIGKAADWTRAHPDDAVTACTDSKATVPACKIAIRVSLDAKDGFTWSSTTRINADAIKRMIPAYADAVPQLKDKTVDFFVDTSVAGTGR